MGDEVTNGGDSQTAAQPNQAGAGGGDLASQIGPETIVQVSHPDFEQSPENGAETQTPGDTPAATAQAQAAPTGADGQDGGGQAPQAPQAPQGPEGQAGEGGEAKPYAVLNYRGQDVPVQTEEQMRNLAQQGFSYNVNMEMLAPHKATLQRIFALQADPEKAPILEALLTGGEMPSGPAAAGTGQAPGQAGGGLPEIFVKDELGNVMRGEDGQPMKADATFMHGIVDTLKALGIDPAKLSQAGQENKAPATDPRVASMVSEREIASYSQYCSDTYGVDFKAAVPKVQEAMSHMGIGTGDPRDTPKTWDGIVAHLVATGQLSKADPAAAGGEARPENKSKLKEQAQVAQASNKQPGGFDRKAAIAAAIKEGGGNAFVGVVGSLVSHPDLEG